MADQAPRRSRRIRGLSPESAEPYSRRRKSNIASVYHPVESDAVERDPPQGIEGFVFGSSAGSERSIPLTSRVLFPQEEEVQVEEVSQPSESLPSPLPPDYLFVVEYIGPESERPEDPLYYSYLSMAMTGNAASAVSAAGIQTPASVEAGGTIASSSIASSAAMFGSGFTQAHASQSGPFCFGMPTSGIPSFSFSAAAARSTPMSSMASGSTSFQGFPFGTGHIPSSNPSLGSFPFTSQT